ncbi:hypothetical protein L3V77_10710 [Vibrio sp. DW001]|uniref:hypothetical protein n=1 Tax=Vibrio sp. DW001 TaxID=2912315 RepID=UPI0023AE9589|nr:hypothetical protein [Vibrio sp. DW001]WED25535.1 hypothetical protein L3V77_10710 [Vibrio sp. DW001]
MFLTERVSGDLIDIVETKDLTSLFHENVVGQYQAGQEEQDPELFKSLIWYLCLVRNCLAAGLIPITE